jgi:hypothetical protein
VLLKRDLDRELLGGDHTVAADDTRMLEAETLIEIHAAIGRRRRSLRRRRRIVGPTAS